MRSSTTQKFTKSLSLSWIVQWMNWIELLKWIVQNKRNPLLYRLNYQAHFHLNFYNYLKKMLYLLALFFCLSSLTVHFPGVFPQLLFDRLVLWSSLSHQRQTCQKIRLVFWLYIHFAPPVGAIFIRAVCVYYDKRILSFFSKIIVLYSINLFTLFAGNTPRKFLSMSWLFSLLKAFSICRIDIPLLAFFT